MEVRETEGCRLAEEDSRTGRLVELSAGLFMVAVSSPACETGDWGGASPLLETRLSRERVMPDLERLWLPTLLLLGGGELVEVVVLGPGRCLCGLGEGRDVMGGIRVWRRRRRKRKGSFFFLLWKRGGGTWERGYVGVGVGVCAWIGWQESAMSVVA